MKRVTYIVSEIDKALAFEWVAERLDRTRFDLRFVLLNNGPSELENYLQNHGIKVKHVHLRKGPGIVITFLALWAHLIINRPSIVHCHLRFATLLGIMASYFAGIRSRIYTRHHSSFHHVYHPHAVKYDKYISRLATHIISISDSVSEILVNREHADRRKIVKIPHGFDLEYLAKPDLLKVALLRRKYLPDNSGPVIGMISRYIVWKGTIYGIQAFGQILQKFPSAKLILANANGPDKKSIKDELLTLPPDSYIEIGFEPDLPSLYSLFDIFVHVPTDAHAEAFGQVYVEALACGIPSVFTLSGIANEFIQDGFNAMVVDYNNSQQIATSVERVLEDDSLKQYLISNGQQSIEQFNLPSFIKKLEMLYDI